MRILVCDDEADAVEELADFLGGYGYTVVAFSNARDAHKEMMASSDPLCVITDVKMPGLSGFDLMDAAIERARVASTPVILITGHMDRQSDPDPRSRLAAGMMQKPLNPGALIEKLKALGV